MISASHGDSDWQACAFILHDVLTPFMDGHPIGRVKSQTDASTPYIHLFHRRIAY